MQADELQEIALPSETPVANKTSVSYFNLSESTKENLKLFGKAVIAYLILGLILTVFTLPLLGLPGLGAVIPMMLAGSTKAIAAVAVTWLVVPVASALVGLGYSLYDKYQKYVKNAPANAPIEKTEENTQQFKNDEKRGKIDISTPLLALDDNDKQKLDNESILESTSEKPSNLDSDGNSKQDITESRGNERSESQFRSSISILSAEQVDIPVDISTSRKPSSLDSCVDGQLVDLRQKEGSGDTEDSKLQLTPDKNSNSASRFFKSTKTDDIVKYESDEEQLDLYDDNMILNVDGEINTSPITPTV